MKKIFFLLLILFSLTGCNSYTELNSLAIIHSIGIEKQETSYKLTASIILESLEKDSSRVYEVEGNSILEAIENLSLTLNKKIYLSHLDLLLLDNSIKTKELEEIIHFFLNETDARNDFLIVTSNNIKSVLENSQRESINNLVKINKQETSKSIYTTMFDVIESFYKQEPIYLTNITIDDEVKIDGVIKLYHNKKTHLENEKILFINYLLNNIETYKYNLNCSGDNFIYFEVLSSNTNQLNNKIFITNEINIISNNCNLEKNEFNSFLNNFFNENLKEFTDKDIIIQNTIRRDYENNKIRK